MKITDYFPYDNPRPGQYEALEHINEAFESYPYVILDAGTGFGKSSVAFSLANAYRKEEYMLSYILTATKQLQTQYLDNISSFNFDIDYQVGMGRSNYTCMMNNEPCNYGDCKLKETTDRNRCFYGLQNPETLDHGGCEYWAAKQAAVTSDVAIMNYDVLLIDSMYVNHYGLRDFMVCDEAHNIESKLMSHVSITLSERTLQKRLGIYFKESDFKQQDVEYWIDFIKDLIHNCRGKIESANALGLKVYQVEEIQTFMKGLEWKLNELMKYKDYWVVNADEFYRKIELKPIKVSKYSDFLLGAARKAMFMSGSFIDHNQFCHDLGIDSDEVYYYKAKSSFDMKTNNPIYRRLAGSMGYKFKGKTLPKTIPILHSIFNENEGKKGLIHCNSKEFANYIMNNINDSRLLSYSSSKEKTSAIEYFKESEDLIMVSYSMTEGVDLPYDGIRFQVFYKIPYLSLADNQIKARLRVDPNWYNVKTMQTLLQAWGRGMRADDDYCRNYIIDSSINRILHDSSFEHLVPTEFREAIQ